MIKVWSPPSASSSQRVFLFSHSVVSDSVTPWTVACQATLSFTISHSLPKLMPTESMMPSNHLILCHPLLLPSLILFIKCRTTGAEAPILCPPDTNSWLIGKDPDAGKNWRQKEKWVAEDEMVGWHHQFKGRELRETVKDREAWHAAVHGVTKSWTPLSNWTTNTHEKWSALIKIKKWNLKCTLGQNSLAVQWLGLWNFNAESPGLISGWRNKISSHEAWPKKKKTTTTFWGGEKKS